MSEPSTPGTYFIGRYRVVDDIGVGGMATVHLGRMDGAGGFQKWVAIKRIHPHLVENEEIIKMFLDEARIAASISHPNVAQVFDLGSQDDTHWIAMEYLHGEPLREVLRHLMGIGGALDPALAARIIADAAEGLHSAHELRGKNGRPLNLVHRDVTPHNLFLTYDGVVNVVDFGIAKVAGRLSTTQAGTLKGKIAYMAPEQIRGKDIDRRTDIFALGVVLWEITTGRRLFRMDTDLETVERVQACLVPAPSSILSGYPAELESIVMRALQKTPEARYQTARDFSRALQQFLMHAGQFVGPEEISAYVRDLFGERIKQREAHLKWAANVTKTLSFDQLRPVIESAGLNVQSVRRDVEGPSTNNAYQDNPYEDIDEDYDDEDDADETVVEPFRDLLMRQEVVRHTKESQPPIRSAVPRPGAKPSATPPPLSPARPMASDVTDSLTIDTHRPAPFPSNLSRARVESLGPGVATDPSATRRVVDTSSHRSAADSSLVAEALTDEALTDEALMDEEDDDEDDEDDVATIVREPSEMLKQDRLIVPGRAIPAPFVSADDSPGPSQSPARAGVAYPARPVPAPPGFSPPQRPVPFQANPMPSGPTRRVAQPVTDSASRPGVPRAPTPGSSLPVSGWQAQQAPMPGVLGAPYPGVDPYAGADPYFDETQWARGLRGSPILVYAAAAVGGFLIVAVLIAVLLGGPDRTPTPIAPTAIPPPSAAH